MTDDPLEPPLRDVFIEQACEVAHESFEQTLYPGSFQTWSGLPAQEQAAWRHAVSDLLDWLDLRRL